MADALNFYLVCLDGDDIEDEPVYAATVEDAAEFYIQHVRDGNSSTHEDLLKKAPCVWISGFVENGPGPMTSDVSTSIPKWHVPAWKEWLEARGMTSPYHRKAPPPDTADPQPM